MNTTTNNGNSKTTTAKPAPTTKAVNHLGWYSTVFSNWPAKVLGPKPTNDELATIHALKARPGKQALANAMALRPGGVTGKQIKHAASLFDGNPGQQLNKMRALVDAGMLAFVPMPATTEGRVYRTKLTPQGVAMVKQNTAHGFTMVGTPSLKAAGAKAAPAKAPTVAKGKGGKAKGAPTAQAAKPAQVPAKPASEAPRTVLTNDGPKVPQPSASDGK